MSCQAKNQRGCKMVQAWRARKDFRIIVKIEEQTEILSIKLAELSKEMYNAYPVFWTRIKRRLQICGLAFINIFDISTREIQWLPDAVPAVPLPFFCSEGLLKA